MLILMLFLIAILNLCIFQKYLHVKYDPQIKPLPIHVNNGKRPVSCTVPCYWPYRFDSILKNIKIDEIPGLTMLMSMEGEGYYPQLSLKNRNFMHGIASTRFDSDVPVPYFSFSEYSIQTLPPESQIPASLFLANNCNSLSNREKLVKELSQKTKLISPSSCMKNVNIPFEERRNKQKFMSLYTFYLAFENQRINDYITEKLWGAFCAGTIPVYFGAPNIMDHVPYNSIINVDSFNSIDDLAQHMNNILKNSTLKNSYHSWKYKNLPRHFLNKYNISRTHSECRTCLWANEKRKAIKLANDLNGLKM